MGSSPLTREIHRPGWRPARQRRFIPARAGNTRSAQRTALRIVGSSPLAREIHNWTCSASARFGFIPARAGNTPCLRLPSPQTPVHPRSRGKYGRHGAHVGVPGRFIPARAGNTGSGTCKSHQPTVHSRSRGKYRGRRWRWRLVVRFIPARAGNTARVRRPSARLAVHPRSRGKYGRSCPWGLVPAGSSPLAREIRRAPGEAGALRRFIPARAGNTCRWRAAAARAAVHPRSRGKYVAPRDRTKLSGGSSPLAREILRSLFAQQQIQRFIPARAGNTPYPSEDTR